MHEIIAFERIQLLFHNFEFLTFIGSLKILEAMLLGDDDLFLRL